MQGLKVLGGFRAAEVTSVYDLKKWEAWESDLVLIDSYLVADDALFHVEENLLGQAVLFGNGNHNPVVKLILDFCGAGRNLI